MCSYEREVNIISLFVKVVYQSGYFIKVSISLFWYSDIEIKDKWAIEFMLDLLNPNILLKSS